VAASIFDLGKLLTHWNALLMVAVWTGIQTTRRVLPQFLTGTAPLARFMPLAPLVLCCIAVWIPGPWLNPDETWGQRLVLGVVLGALTSNLHNIASRLGLHGLLRLEPDPEKKRPKKAAEPA
jgi:hypothetical protein